MLETNRKNVLPGDLFVKHLTKCLILNNGLTLIIDHDLIIMSHILEYKHLLPQIDLVSHYYVHNDYYSINQRLSYA